MKKNSADRHLTIINLFKHIYIYIERERERGKTQQTAI